jgi:uncharacterized membrane protein YedE/YeeE
MKFSHYLRYLLIGTAFGFVLVKSEVISWFRIQEMFRFDDFHMFGIIGAAVIVGMISIQIINRFNIKDIDGNPIKIQPKDPSQYKRYIIGGSMFGLGWAMLGACPAPLFILLGSGVTVIIIPIAAAIFGTWMYGAMINRLPH